MNSTSGRAEEATDDTNDAIGPEIDVPGPYPAAHGDPTGEPLSSDPEPTKETRDAGSLGQLTGQISTSTAPEETGGLRSPIYDDEQNSE
jgi:hypothetical protein